MLPSSDRYHQESFNFIKQTKDPLIRTFASITETLYLLGFNRNAQIDFLEWIGRGAVEIHDIQNKVFLRLKELTEKYCDSPMNFSDSSLVYMAEQLNINTIATIDRDFTVYQDQKKKKV